MACAAACDDDGRGCIFARALLVHSADCELAQRREIGERLRVDCSSPVARINCATLAALLHERARFALRLAPAGQPLLHLQTLRLQCGGLAAIAQVLGSSDRDVHRLVGLVHEVHGSSADLPWATIVAALTQWRPPRRRTAGR